MGDRNLREISIHLVCLQLKMVLTEKNRRYGNSALKPINVFNKQKAIASLYVRMDDKISRYRASDVLRKNDVCDILGYGVLIAIAKKWGTWYLILNNTQRHITNVCNALEVSIRMDNNTNDFVGALRVIENNQVLKRDMLYELMKACVHICIKKGWLDWSDLID